MIEGRVVDVGSHGLGLLSPVSVVNNTVIQIAVQVPMPSAPGKFQVVTGTVRVAFGVLRGGEYQLSVEWVQLDDAQRQIISQYLEKISQPQRS